MMKHQPVVFIFNSPLASGCDYVAQTMRIVSETHPSYGIALGDIVSFPLWVLSKDRWMIRHMYGATVIRPVSLIPGIRFRFVRMFAYAGTALALRIYVDITHGFKHAFLWFFEPFHIPHLLACFAGYSTVYDCVDYYPGFNLQAKNEHDALMRESRFIFANSESLARKLRKARPDVVTVPLGFAPELFRHVRVKPIRPNKRPFTVGYIGGISDRMDFPLLKKIARELPDMRFVFIGFLEPNVFGVQDNVIKSFRLLCRSSNVLWVPGVAKSQVASYLSQFDVGIIPYRTNLSFNRYAFPMKIMEYFALGRAVVTTDIMTLRRYVSRVLLTSASSYDAFVHGIKYYQRYGWNDAHQIRQKTEAAKNTWEKKVSKIMQVIFE